MTIRKGRKIIAGNGAAAIASTQNPGLVQPDGKTILIDEAGVISSLGGGSSFNIDDQTITLNEEENIQVVGNKTLDGSFKNEWIGTKAEYDKAVESGIITEETVCIITDDEDIIMPSGGLEIGDIGIAPLGIDETKGKRRYLNGQLIIQDQYAQFTNKVKSAVALYPSLACTESEWQTTSTMTVGGQVGKFVVDDEAGTIRLPKIIMPIQGLTDLTKLGEIVEAGLPNITGTFQGGRSSAHTGFVEPTEVFQRSGAFDSYATGNADMYNYSFDASRSNPIYGNSNTVQQEQIQYPYFIQVATGAETEDNIINEIELNNPFSLLDYKYSEYELNNLSWLRSNGQFNSKTIYPAVYELLLKIYNGNETKAGVNVKLSTEAFTDYDFVLNTAEETFRLPIKVKLASGKAVVGNGLALGLIGKENAGGLVNGYNSNSIKNSVYVSSNEYGIAGEKAGGATPIAGDNNAYFVGVTTDPTKSGIETSDSGLYLYFYVGETVQNANLVNIGRIQETMVTNTMVDGKWVQKLMAVSTVTNIGSYTYDLSEYLPNDGYDYEVRVYASMASADATVLTIGTVEGPHDNLDKCFWGIIKTTANARYDTGNFTLPIRDRKIYLQITDYKVSSGSDIRLIGYRRLGTNS